MGRTLSWGALSAFVDNIGPESATAREIAPDAHEWNSRTKTNAILADIFDALAIINAQLASMRTGNKLQIPEAYDRPGNKQANNSHAKHVGTGNMTYAEFDAWLESKRREALTDNGGRND